MGNKVINTTSVKLGIYEVSTDSQLVGMLGDIKEFEDGRKFVLCSSGTGSDLTAGVLVQSKVLGAGDDALTITATAAGQSEVAATANSSGTYSAGDLQGGYLVVNKGSTPDIGTFYKIKDNEALTETATGVIEIYDKFVTALTAASNQITICPNPYHKVVKDANSAPIVGVPLIGVDKSTSTTTYFFWALFAGFGPAIDSSAAITAGQDVERESGDVKVFAHSGADGPLGTAYSVGAANEALIVRYFGIG